MLPTLMLGYGDMQVILHRQLLQTLLQDVQILHGRSKLECSDCVYTLHCMVNALQTQALYSTPLDSLAET